MIVETVQGLSLEKVASEERNRGVTKADKLDLDQVRFFMDKQVFEGKFTEISGAFKQKLSSLNLSEEELRNTNGDFDQIVSLVSQKLGIPKEEASVKVKQVMSSLNLDESSTNSFSEKVAKTFEEIKSKFIH